MCGWTTIFHAHLRADPHMRVHMAMSYGASCWKKHLLSVKAVTNCLKVDSRTKPSWFDQPFFMSCHCQTYEIIQYMNVYASSISCLEAGDV